MFEILNQFNIVLMWISHCLQSSCLTGLVLLDLFSFGCKQTQTIPPSNKEDIMQTSYRSYAAISSNGSYSLHLILYFINATVHIKIKVKYISFYNNNQLTIMDLNINVPLATNNKTNKAFLLHSTICWSICSVRKSHQAFCKHENERKKKSNSIFFCEFIL